MKKRILSFMVAMAMMCALLPALPASAYNGTKYGDYLYYKVHHDNNVGITDCDESAVNVTIPSQIEGKSVKYIDNFAFSDCASLANVSIPNSVEVIGNQAFSDCASLANVSIPNSVKTIDRHAFDGCRSFTSINIPNSVTHISDCVFTHCYSLKRIDVDTRNKNYSSENGVLFSNKSKQKILCYPNGKSDTKYTVPDSVEVIEDYAFFGHSSLTSIYIPRSVTEIGYNAFHSCSSLKDVYYSGTETEWKSIDIDEFNKPLINAAIHYNSSAISVWAQEEESQATSEPETEFSGLPEEMEISIEQKFAQGVEFNRPKSEVTLTIDDTDVAEVEEGIYLTDENDNLDYSKANFNIIPKAPGEATLTATASDGSTLKCKLTVTPVIAETITDEAILKARILHDNEAFHYYKNKYDTPAKRFGDSCLKGGTKDWSRLYIMMDDIVDNLTLNFNFAKDLKQQKYYEAVLADIIENDNNEIWQNTMTVWKNVYDGYNNTIVQKIIGTVNDVEKERNNKFSKFLKNHTETLYTVKDFKDQAGTLKDVKLDVDLFDKIGLSADLVSDFFDAVDTMYAYSTVQQEKIDMLKEIKDTTEDKHLKKACDSLISDVQLAHENTVAYFAKNFGTSTVKDLWDFSSSLAVGFAFGLIKKGASGKLMTPAVEGYTSAQAILKGGQFISDHIINADDVSKEVLSTTAYAAIEEIVKECATKAESRFVDNETTETAMSFISHADFMKATMLQGHDVFERCVKEIQKGKNRMNIVSKIVDLFSGRWDRIFNDAFEKTDYDAILKSNENLKLGLVGANFYFTTQEVTKFISVIRSTTPSAWAKPFVDKAINYDILFDPDTQNNYQNNITRAEFCMLMVNMIDSYTRNKQGSDDGIYGLIDRKGKQTDLFKDTFYPNVYDMAQLGIVAGVSETEFQPLGEITREQAATMLMRAAKVLGVDTSASDTNLNGVSDWAKEGVNFVVYNDIMTGTDNGFEPQGTYTKEQAITTMVRFYENL